MGEKVPRLFPSIIEVTIVSDVFDINGMRKKVSGFSEGEDGKLIFMDA